MDKQSFRAVDPLEIDPIFERIGKDWMLISASDSERKNTMTASWGTCGILWNKPVAVCFIRPQRYTCPIVETADRLSLAFFDGAYRDALSYCGRHSGRDGDKFAASGLTPVMTEEGVPYPKEASLVLVCRKLYADTLKMDGFLDPSLLSHYPAKDFHRVFVCEIEQALVRNASFDSGSFI